MTRRGLALLVVTLAPGCSVAFPSSSYTRAYDAGSSATFDAAIVDASLDPTLDAFALDASDGAVAIDAAAVVHDSGLSGDCRGSLVLPNCAVSGSEHAVLCDPVTGRWVDATALVPAWTVPIRAGSIERQSIRGESGGELVTPRLVRRDLTDASSLAHVWASGSNVVWAQTSIRPTGVALAVTPTSTVFGGMDPAELSATGSNVAVASVSSHWLSSWRWGAGTSTALSFGTGVTESETLGVHPYVTTDGLVVARERAGIVRVVAGAATFDRTGTFLGGEVSGSIVWIERDDGTAFGDIFRFQLGAGLTLVETVPDIVSPTRLSARDADGRLVIDLGTATLVGSELTLGWRRCSGADCAETPAVSAVSFLEGGGSLVDFRLHGIDVSGERELVVAALVAPADAPSTTDLWLGVVGEAQTSFSMFRVGTQREDAARGVELALHAQSVGGVLEAFVDVHSATSTGERLDLFGVRMCVADP